MHGLVTVFGGSGFLGRYTVRALAKDGWRIRVALRRPHLTPELRVMGDVGQIELVQANLRHADSVERALDGANACVNLVGLLYESGRQTFEALHVEAAARLAVAAAAAGARTMAHVSAIGADPSSPSLYARTKAKGEAEVRKAFPKASLLRPSIIFGEEDDFFNRFAAMAAVSPALPLIGGGETKFQPVYAGDVGAAVAAALRRPEAAGGLFELGGPATLSFRALMTLLLAETHMRRILLSVPFPVAGALGAVAGLAAAVGLPPVLTRDQVELLKSDNIASGPGLAALGVTPTALEAVLPLYLWKYRKGGQFAAHVPL